MPGSGGSSKAQMKSSPGWRQAVKPFRDWAYFWHQIWQSCGRPHNTEIHKIMRKTRNQYHHEYKKCEKAEDNTPGTAGGPGGRDRTLAVESRKNIRKITFFS